jgi:hypothetical protein
MNGAVDNSGLDYMDDRQPEEVQDPQERDLLCMRKFGIPYDELVRREAIGRLSDFPKD